MIDPVVKESIEKRIAELEDSKAKVVEQANAQLNAISGAVGELQQLIVTLDAPEENKEEVGNGRPD
jgi:wyosine [tRNA(Phe)-imidazoG37] synthetase (radical SAM superfamily)